MGKRYVENDTANTIYVGGRMIPPGEGREIDEPDAGPTAEKQLSEEGNDDNGDELLRELLKGNVALVGASLEGLSDLTLQRLKVMETEAEKPRKGVLTAIGDALLKLANDKLESDDLDDDQNGGGDGTGDAGDAGGNTPAANTEPQA